MSRPGLAAVVVVFLYQRAEHAVEIAVALQAHVENRAVQNVSIHETPL